MSQTHQSQQTCATCARFEPARLDGYGYCKAAPTLEKRARLLHVTYDCVFDRWLKK